MSMYLRTSSPKMGDFGGKIREGVVRCLPRTNSFILLGFYACANFGENPSRNANVRVHADRHTDRQTGFIICHMLYAIATG